MRRIDAGVDDIVAKPFSYREVLARINALLRRQKSSQSAVRSAFGELTFDPHEQCIMAGCHRIPLRPTDFRLLRFLAMNSESAHSRSVLIENVWGGPHHANPRTVDVQVTRLRQFFSARLRRRSREVAIAGALGATNSAFHQVCIFGGSRATRRLQPRTRDGSTQAQPSGASVCSIRSQLPKIHA